MSRTLPLAPHRLRTPLLARRLRTPLLAYAGCALPYWPRTGCALLCGPAGCALPDWPMHVAHSPTGPCKSRTFPTSPQVAHSPTGPAQAVHSSEGRAEIAHSLVVGEPFGMNAASRATEHRYPEQPASAARVYAGASRGGATNRGGRCQRRRLARLGSSVRISCRRSRSMSAVTMPTVSGAWAITVPQGSMIMLRPKQVRPGSWSPIWPAATT